ncbi:MAG: hypothetical protein AAFW64_07110 [Pseudomonadota bacterium]
MIPSGPTAVSMPVRPGADLQQGPQTQTAPTATSATEGDDRSAVAAETAQVVDPARQGADTRALPQNQTNDEARLVEPSRLASETLAQQTVAPDEKTPAGPPPTFDWSVLEKARALAASGAQEAPKPAPEAADTAEAPARAPETSQTPVNTDPTVRDTPEPQARDATLAGDAAGSNRPDGFDPSASNAPQTASKPAKEGSVPPGVEA